MSTPEAIDLTTRITTPENIQFDYRIAGPFRRLPAFVIDLALRVILFLTLALLLLFASGLAGGGSLTTIAFFTISVMYFVFDWFYGVIFEALCGGRTPGKYLTRIRVLTVQGRPITGFQAALRNFLRLGDMAPFVSLEFLSPDAPPMYWIPTFFVTLLCMTLTRKFQRLGDLAAGTMVVVDDRGWRPPQIKFADPRVAALSQFIPVSFRVTQTMGKAISLYVERRDRMPIPRRVELASILAKPLLVEFDFIDDIDSDLLLCAIYYREFIRDENESIQSNAPPPPSRSASNPNANATAVPPPMILRS